MLGEKHRDTHKPQQPGSLLQTQGDLTGAQTGDACRVLDAAEWMLRAGQRPV
jgi:hypothetical protein